MSDSENQPPNKNDKIGTDEWVAQVDDRQREQNTLIRSWNRIPETWRYTIVILLALLFPIISSTDLVLDAFGIGNNAFILRIGVRFLTFAILAIGLNVVVGYAGLLDLGYIAFMGLAGYFLRLSVL